jgi:Domain of unknown function (DUF4336)
MSLARNAGLLACVLFFSSTLFRCFHASTGSMVIPVTALNLLETNVLPLSTRRALADRAKQINAPFVSSTEGELTADAAKTESPPNFVSRGWSNRAASLITPVHLATSEDPFSSVYTADRPFYWNSIDVGCRCTIIELPPSSGGDKPDLWIHSPVQLDGPMMQCIQSIGNVRHVCSTNYEHLKFANVWYQNFDTASMWGCPGLAERMPEIRWKGEIPSGYRPTGWAHNRDTIESLPSRPLDGMWDESLIQSLHINVEKNPFTGRPFFNEVIFYHVPTKTLLTTDLFWNYPSNGVANSEFGRDDSWELAPSLDDGVPLSSRLWKFGMDKVYYPFYTNLMVTDKAEYQAIANHIVNVWDVETIIPAHGDILRGKDFIRSVLMRYFQLES